MEFTIQLIYLAAALMILGTIFGAYRGINKSFNFDESTFFWFYALIAQFLSFLGMFAYPYIGKASLVVGNSAQIAGAVLLCLLFRSFNKPLPKQYILTLAWILVVVGVAFSTVDYQTHIVVEYLLLTILFAWQIYELFSANQKKSSVYLVFLTSVVALQLLCVLLLWAFENDILGSAIASIDRLSEYGDNEIEIVLRMVLAILYLLIFLGISNFFFEKLWKIAIDVAHAKEDQMLHAMNALAAARDNETGKHTVRTQHFARALAKDLMRHGQFANVINEKFIDTLFHAAPLHDIGKVGIPDHILLKEGRHTPEESAVMQTHTTLGVGILSAAKSEHEDDVINKAIVIAGAHHERWDGSGYPSGLSGDAIPLSGRIMAIADVYDALTTRRHYKDSWSHKDASEEIIRNRGIHFDPQIVDAFERVNGEFELIAEGLRD